MELKHNYVVAGDAGYYLVGYYDIMNHAGINYYTKMQDGIQSRFVLNIQRLTFSEKVNKVLRNPFSWFSYPRIFPGTFENDKPLVYLFFGQYQYLYQSSYLEYLRRKHPGVKLVLYMQDLVSRNFQLDFPKVQNRFDLILSYDKGDCEKYGLEFYPTPYSQYPVPDNPSIKPFDVFYCGNAKMRGREILDVYHQCKQHGLKCKFFITAMPKEHRVYNDDIVYDYYISYIENLQYVQKSKCILEVMQVNADGFTPRLWESIVYDKHLLTNNSMLDSTVYYEPKSMHKFNDIDKIKDWIDKPVVNEMELKSRLSPVHLFQHIDNLLSDTNL